MKKPTSNYIEDANAFLANNGINCRITISDSKAAHWSPSGHHYRVTLSKRNKSYPSRIVFDFWGSVSDAEKGLDPSAYDVLACLSGDAQCADSFAEFCGDMGCDTDSIKAKQLFNRCNRFGKKLRAFFSTDELDQLSKIY